MRVEWSFAEQQMVNIQLGASMELVISSKERRRSSKSTQTDYPKLWR
jgi:hypothetical protein